MGLNPGYLFKSFLLYLIILIIEIMLVLVYSTVLTLLMLYAILTFNNFIFEQACTSAYFCWHLSQKSNVLVLYKNLHKHCSLIYCPYVMSKRWKQFAVLQFKGLDLKVTNQELSFDQLIRIFINLLSKGQIILEANFEVFIWTKNRAKIFLYFCPRSNQKKNTNHYIRW